MKLLLAIVSAFAVTGMAFAEDAAKSSASTPTAHNRDLYMAPPQGWVTTRDNTAFFTLEGQVAQGFFDKMPSSSIIKDPFATCSPTGIVKLSDGMLCTHFPARKSTAAHYECEMLIDLQTGKLLAPSNECGEDDEFIQEERKKRQRIGIGLTENNCLLGQRHCRQRRWNRMSSIPDWFSCVS